MKRQFTVSPKQYVKCTLEDFRNEFDAEKQDKFYKRYSKFIPYLESVINDICSEVKDGVHVTIPNIRNFNGMAIVDVIVDAPDGRFDDEIWFVPPYAIRAQDEASLRESMEYKLHSMFDANAYHTNKYV